MSQEPCKNSDKGWLKFLVFVFNIPSMLLNVTNQSILGQSQMIKAALANCITHILRNFNIEFCQNNKEWKGMVKRRYCKSFCSLW